MLGCYLLQSIQRRLCHQVDDIDYLSYEERLKELGLFSIYGRLLRADVIKCWKIFHGEVDVGLRGTFSIAIDRWT